MIKLIVSFFLVTIVVCANVGPRDVFDDAELALERYKITVREVMDNISATFNEIYDQIYHTSVAIVNIANRVITRAQNDYLDRLIDLEASVLAQGVDPSSCVDQAQLEIIQFPIELIADMENCMNQIVRENYARLATAFLPFGSIEQTVDEYAERIETCRSTNDEVCALILVAQISLHNDLLPVVLEADIQGLSNQFSNLEPLFQTCSRAPTNDVYIRGDIIVETAHRCVENLLNSQPIN